MYYNMKQEETSRMIEEDMTIFTKIQKGKINIKRIKTKRNFYQNIFYLIFIIFLIQSIFTDIDNTKRPTRTSLLTRARNFMKNCTDNPIILII